MNKLFSFFIVITISFSPVFGQEEKADNISCIDKKDSNGKLVKPRTQFCLSYNEIVRINKERIKQDKEPIDFEKLPVEELENICWAKIIWLDNGDYKVVFLTNEGEEPGGVFSSVKDARKKIINKVREIQKIDDIL